MNRVTGPTEFNCSSTPNVQNDFFDHLRVLIELMLPNLVEDIGVQVIVVSIRSQRWFKSHCTRALAAKTRCCFLMLTVLFSHAHCTVFSPSLSVVSGSAYMRRRPRSVYQQIEQGLECTWHRDRVRPNPQTGVGFRCCCARASSVGELPVLSIMWFCGAFFLPGKHGTGQYYTLEDV